LAFDYEQFAWYTRELKFSLKIKRGEVMKFPLLLTYIYTMKLHRLATYYEKGQQSCFFHNNLEGHLVLMDGKRGDAHPWGSQTYQKDIPEGQP
jgi:hypothetical protein